MATLALLAVCLGCGPIAERAAAQLPEWGSCSAIGSGRGGRYVDPGCVTRAVRRAGKPQGGYEWAPLAAGQISQLRPMTAVGPVSFQTPAGREIECLGLGPESFGRAKGPSGAATPLWELEGCGSEGQECRSGLASSLGEIDDMYAWLEEPAEQGGPRPGWSGRLGFVSKTDDPPSVGIEFTVSNDERLFDPVSCNGPIGTVWIGGARTGGDSFIGTLTPMDKMSAEFTETYSQSAPGVQTPAKLEGHRARTIMAFLENHWEPVAITASFHLQVEAGRGELEIKAAR